MLYGDFLKWKVRALSTVIIIWLFVKQKKSLIIQNKLLEVQNGHYFALYVLFFGLILTKFSNRNMIYLTEKIFILRIIPLYYVIHNYKRK